MEDIILVVLSPRNFNALKKYQNLFCLAAFLNLSIGCIAEFSFFDSIKSIVQSISLTLLFVFLILFILVLVRIKILKKEYFCRINEKYLYLEIDNEIKKRDLVDIDLYINLARISEKDSYSDWGHFIELSDFKGKRQLPIRFESTLLNIFPQSNVHYRCKSPILMTETRSLFKSLLNLLWATS